MFETIIQSCYFISSFLFILSLGGLSHPKSSRKGNYIGIYGMLIAIIITFFTQGFEIKEYIKFLVFIPGGIIGLILALKVIINKFFSYKTNLK